jgi:hypothetical protein
MSKKTERKPDDPEQSKRFIATAEKVGATEEILERALKPIAEKRVSPKPIRRP